MKRIGIALREFPMFGEIIFPDEPDTVYVNQCATPQAKTRRVHLGKSDVPEVNEARNELLGSICAALVKLNYAQLRRVSIFTANMK